ncbi:MAG: adenosylmethionine decarboxylase [Pyrodictiaceae archaeon]
MNIQKNIVTRNGLEKAVDQIIGRHVFGNLYGIDPKMLGDEKYIVETVLEAARRAKATILEIKSWTVEGPHGGVSAIALVVESHIAIHTWPGYEYATVDVYTCGSTADPLEAFKTIIKRLRPRNYVAFYADRSSGAQIDELEVKRIKL